MTRAGFWGSAAAAAGVFAAAAAWLLPYDALHLDTPDLRRQAWLLTLWTGGVLCICFGLAGYLGHGMPLGYREVAQAGSLGDALRERHLARSAPPFEVNFAGWLVAAGAALVVLYFAAWSLS